MAFHGADGKGLKSTLQNQPNNFLSKEVEFSKIAKLITCPESKRENFPLALGKMPQNKGGTEAQ